jgi:peptidoglycan/LPS O-acetylase OafA/YrhL
MSPPSPFVRLPGRVSAGRALNIPAAWPIAVCVHARASVSGPPRLPYIDGLRFLLAVFIVLHHAFWDYPRLFMHASPLLYLFTKNDRYAVLAFFFLSGYCLMLPEVAGTRRRSSMRFLLKRAARLLAPYYAGLELSLLLSAFFIGTRTGFHWDASLPVTPRGILYDLTLTQNFFHAELAVNYSYWYIATLFQISLAFPLMLKLWRRDGPLAAALLITLSMLLEELHLWPNVAGMYLTMFIVGMVSASLAFSAETAFAQLRERLPWAGLSILLGIAVLLQTMDPLDTLHLSAFWGAYRFTWLMAFLLCLFVALPQGAFPRLRAFLGWKPFAQCGVLAYAMYIVHAPIVQLFQQYMVVPLRLPERFAEALAVLVMVPSVMVVAGVFYALFEKGLFAATRRIGASASPFRSLPQTVAVTEEADMR